MAIYFVLAVYIYIYTETCIERTVLIDGERYI